MKKSSSYLIALVFSAAIISETHCMFFNDEEKCRGDYGICLEDSLCCSKLCIFEPGMKVGRCYGEESNRLVIDPPTNLFRSIGHLCELKGNTTDSDNVFEKEMYQKYGPLNVAFDYYPTNTTVELTINNITRFVVVNELHNKKYDSSPVLKLSPTAAKEFLVSFTGLVPCEFHVPPTPFYYTYKFWIYTIFISTMVLSPIVLLLIF